MKRGSSASAEKKKTGTTREVCTPAGASGMVAAALRSILRSSRESTKSDSAATKVPSMRRVGRTACRMEVEKARASPGSSYMLILCVVNVKCCCGSRNESSCSLNASISRKPGPSAVKELWPWTT